MTVKPATKTELQSDNHTLSPFPGHAALHHSRMHAGRVATEGSIAGMELQVQQNAPLIGLQKGRQLHLDTVHEWNWAWLNRAMNFRWPEAMKSASQRHMYSWLRPPRNPPGLVPQRGCTTCQAKKHHLLRSSSSSLSLTLRSSEFSSPSKVLPPLCRTA